MNSLPTEINSLLITQKKAWSRDLANNFRCSMRQVLHQFEQLTELLEQSLAKKEEINIIPESLMLDGWVLEALVCDAFSEYENADEKKLEIATKKNAQGTLDAFNQVLSKYCDKYKLPEFPKLTIETCIKDPEGLRQQVCYMNLVSLLLSNIRDLSEFNNSLSANSALKGKRLDRNQLMQIKAVITKAWGRIAYCLECIEGMPKELCTGDSISRVNERLEAFSKILKEICSVLPEGILPAQLQTIEVLLPKVSVEKGGRRMSIVYDSVEYDRAFRFNEAIQVMKRLANVSTQIQRVKNWARLWKGRTDQEKIDPELFDGMWQNIYSKLELDLSYLSRANLEDESAKIFKRYEGLITQMMHDFRMDAKFYDHNSYRASGLFTKFHERLGKLYPPVILARNIEWTDTARSTVAQGEDVVLSPLKIEETDASIFSTFSEEGWPEEFTEHVEQGMQQVLYQVQDLTSFLSLKLLEEDEESDKSAIVFQRLIVILHAFEALLWPLEFEGGLQCFLEVFKGQDMQGALESLNESFESYCNKYQLPTVAVLSISSVLESEDTLKVEKAIHQQIVCIGLIYSLWEGVRFSEASMPRNPERMLVTIRQEGVFHAGSILYYLERMGDMWIQYFSSDACNKIKDKLISFESAWKEMLSEENIKAILSIRQSNDLRRALQNMKDIHFSLFKKHHHEKQVEFGDGRGMFRFEKRVTMLKDKRVFNGKETDDERAAKLKKQRHSQQATENIKQLVNVRNQVEWLEQFTRYWKSESGKAMDPMLLEAWCRNGYLRLEGDLESIRKKYHGRFLLGMKYEPYRNKIIEYIQAAQASAVFSTVRAKQALNPFFSLLKVERMPIEHLEQGVDQVLRRLRVQTKRLECGDEGMITSRLLVVPWRVIESWVKVLEDLHLDQASAGKDIQIALNQFNQILEKYCEQYKLPLAGLNLEMASKDSEGFSRQIAYVELICELYIYNKSPLQNKDLQEISHSYGSIVYYLEGAVTMPERVYSVAESIKKELSKKLIELEGINASRLEEIPLESEEKMSDLGEHWVLDQDFERLIIDKAMVRATTQRLLVLREFWKGIEVDIFLLEACITNIREKLDSLNNKLDSLNNLPSFGLLNLIPVYDELRENTSMLFKDPIFSNMFVLQDWMIDIGVLLIKLDKLKSAEEKLKEASEMEVEYPSLRP